MKIKHIIVLVLTFWIKIGTAQNCPNSSFARDTTVKKELANGILCVKKYKHSTLRSEIHYFKGKKIYIEKFNRTGKARKKKIMFPSFILSGA